MLLPALDNRDGQISSKTLNMRVSIKAEVLELGKGKFDTKSEVDQDEEELILRWPVKQELLQY